MSASKFANIIIDKLNSTIGGDASDFNSETPKKANIAIAEGITEYLLNNVKISIKYVGNTTTTPPSPYTTTDSCGITGSCAPLSGITFDSWVKDIENNIVSGFFIDNGIEVKPTIPSPAFIPGLILLQEDVKIIHLSNINNPQKPVWEFICQKIIDWLEKIVSIPYSSITETPPSTGISTVTKIEAS